jgi:hypothetical protein
VRDATGGAGVDVALNSLAGGKQAATLALLAPGARFVEIGKRDAVEGGTLPQAAFLSNASFVSAHIDMLATEDVAAFARLLREVVAGVADGALPPLPTRVMPFSEAGAALRAISRGVHTGKLVLQGPPGWAPPGLDDPAAPAYVAPDVNRPPPLLPPAVGLGLPQVPMDERGTLVVSGGTSGELEKGKGGG